MFLLEAAPAVVLGLIASRVLSDSPSRAHWLSAAEARALTELLEREAAAAPGDSTSPLYSLAVPRVWGWGLIYFFIVIALYGFAFWAPQILKSLGGLSDIEVGILVAVPYAAAAILMLPWARHSDRTGERRWHLVLAAILGAIGFAGAAMTGSVAMAVIAFTLAVVGVYAACPIFWTLPASALPPAAAASGIALINSIGNAAGYVGPFAMGWLRQSTGGYVAGLGVLAASMFAGAITALILTPSRRRPQDLTSDAPR
jgi:MFS transporter, ACS family, tartrate transporter